MSEYCVFEGWGKCPKKAKKQTKKQTNADRIRSAIQTDEGLADLIDELDPDSDAVHYCESNDECTDLLDKGERPTKEMCRKCLMKWLHQEAEEHHG